MKEKNAKGSNRVLSQGRDGGQENRYEDVLETLFRVYKTELGIQDSLSLLNDLSS